ncbi:phage holin family protein [Lysobacter sp. D1-1-M9]|uniref:phage holin family protein n=1 Tax=Novilysobacter longmucuonensis TaxID=3098603 RepID=UPI002FC67379
MNSRPPHREPAHDEYGAQADQLSAAAREALRHHASAEQAELDAADQAEAQDDVAGPDPAPELIETLRQLGQTARAGTGAAGDTAKALRSLVAADLSLARSAFGRTLALTGAAIALGLSFWLLLSAALVTFLSLQLGVPWSLSLLAVALLSAGITGYCGWRAMRYFDHTRMQATRRQLARVGIGEPADSNPEPGRVAPTHDATGQHPPDDDGPPARDRRSVEVAPP